jgi:hypothetical protein
MANLTSSQIKDSYQSVLTTSETTSDPTTGTLQNGKGTAITTLTVSGTVNATTLGGTLSTASQPNVTSVGTLTSLTSSGTVTATKLVPTGNVTAGNGMYLPTTNALAFSTDGGERVRIDASGNAMIGTTSNDGRRLTVAGNTNDLSGIGITHLGVAASSIEINTAGAMVFGLNVSDGKTERMRIDASGNVGVGVAPTSRNNTRLQIVDGIGFPATQVASSDPNTLDDYEEGTFSPTINGLTLGNADTFFAYTKIGRVVHVNMDIIWGSTTSSSGDWTFSVPFAGAQGAGGGSAFLLDTGTAAYVVPAITSSATYGNQIRIGSGTTGFINNTTPFTWVNGDRFSCAVTYNI